MSEAQKYYLSAAGHLMEGEELGRIGVYLASDYDQLKAENEAYKKLHDWLKAENERLAAMLNQAVSEGILLSDQRDTLRKQLDEARDLLEMSRTYLMRVGDKESIDAWLEATKK